MVNPRKLYRVKNSDGSGAGPQRTLAAVAPKGHFAAYTRDGRRFASSTAAPPRSCSAVRRRSSGCRPRPTPPSRCRATRRTWSASWPPPEERGGRCVRFLPGRPDGKKPSASACMQRTYSSTLLLHFSGISSILIVYRMICYSSTLLLHFALYGSAKPRFESPTYTSKTHYSTQSHYFPSSSQLLHSFNVFSMSTRHYFPCTKRFHHYALGVHRPPMSSALPLPPISPSYIYIYPEFYFVSGERSSSLMASSNKTRKRSLVVALLCCLISTRLVGGEDPYRFFTWNVTFGDIYPLGIRQQGILINGQFPGPDIYSQTNDNVIINVFNRLTEPLLLSWNGVQQRGNSWEDGVAGTNCPIPPGSNFTYVMHFKDQIGSFFYFPSLAFHKAAGGFGGIRIRSRPGIPVPFADPAEDFTVLIGDWYKSNHADLKARLDGGKRLPFPDAILINGRSSNGASFTVEQGKTYRLRISNVGLQTSLNIRIQGHEMTLVEVEGTHTIQNSYSSLDVHLGQSLSVLVTADQPAGDYYIAVSTRFTKAILTATAILHYSDSKQNASGPIPDGPTNELDWSLQQARTILTNLTASGPRPNPQGSYHYGSINVTRTIRLANSAALVNGKQRYAVNSVSFVEADTPLKLADRFNISGVFRLGSIADRPTGAKAYLDTSVMAADFRAFVEVVFENRESIVQNWHIDGYNFWVVGMDGGQWSPANRKNYNLNDAVSRCTLQVYPKSWTAVYVALDNVGMWNVRSEFWARRYLGQQFYIRIYSPANSERDEHRIPDNALLCGRAARKTTAFPFGSRAVGATYFPTTKFYMR